MSRLDEFKHSFPKNPSDGDIHTDVDGMQWVFIGGKNKKWELNLKDKRTYDLYTCVDHLPPGNPDDESGISGAENVFRWLDDNI